MRCLAALLSCLALLVPPTSFAFAPIVDSTGIRATAPHRDVPSTPLSMSSSSLSAHEYYYYPLDDVASTMYALARPMPIAYHDMIFDSSSLVLSSSSSSSSTLDVVSSPGGFFDAHTIKVAFIVATFLPQLPWLFLILLPNAGVTRKLLGGYGEI